MKALKALWRAILRFFARKTTRQKLDQVVSKRSEKQTVYQPKRPTKHNNRKRTNGRVIQEIIFDGRARYVHHPVSFRQF